MKNVEFRINPVRNSAAAEGAIGWYISNGVKNGKCRMGNSQFSLLNSSFFLLCLCVFVPCALGTTYYVDDANGSDSANGLTEGAAWKTKPYIGNVRGGSTLAQGDTIEFKNGNYGTFTETGLAAHRTLWTTYAAHGNHTPSLTRISVTGDNYKNSYLRWNGFNIKNGVLFQKGSYFYIYDCNVTSEDEGIDGYYAPYFSSTDAAIKSRYDVNNVTVENCLISYSTTGLYFGQDRSADWTIKNNRIFRFAGDGLVPQRSTRLTLEGNLIYDIHKGRTTFGLVGTISGVFQVGETIIQAGSGAEGVVALIDSSTKLSVYTTTEQLFLTAGGGGGTVTGQSSGATLSAVSKCDYSHSEPIQWETGLAAEDTVISGNTFIASLSGLVYLNFYGYGKNITIENNLCYSETPSTNAFAVGGVTSGLKVFNNTFGTGFKLSTGSSASGSNQPSILDEFYNNVMTGYSQSTDSGAVYMRVLSHGNNIFGSDPDGLGGPLYPFEVNDVSEDVTEIVTGEFADLFVDYAGNDFNLVLGSAAIDFGTASYGPDTDILGNARVGDVDLGAYEYQGEPNLANDPPVLNVVGNKTVREGDTVTFIVSAVDPDGDPLTYNATLPTGATFVTNTFTWKPSYTQSGTYIVTLSATDGELWDFANIQITVTNVPRYLIW